MNARVVWIACAAIVACGARTDLGGAKKSDAAASCQPAPAPTSHCTGWTMHQTSVFAKPPPPGQSLEIEGVIRTGCEALVAWASWDSSGDATSVWTTATLGFDGASDGTVAHPGLSAKITGSPSLSLAQNGGRVGALESDETGCRFVALDASGHETSSVVSAGATGCGLLAPDGDAFSFLRAQDGELTPVTLTKLDASGQPGSPTTLSLPSGQALWDRLAFDDQTFLLYTFIEDTTTGAYTGWLAPFDATGATLAPQVTETGVPTAPLSLAATKSGALASWTWSSAKVRPIERHGAPTGPDVDVTGPATVYDTLLVPAPDGDVLFAWTELDGAAFSLHAIALAPDGTPRGPATVLDPKMDDARLYGAVESTGARALLVRSTIDGLAASSLDCVE
ncbi:MAG TPA: hypothetical protein VGH28_03205 [Polyangiaceae bacterium]